ncbi:MAG: hypothetical protein RR645_06200 [Clostridium sp.]
MYGKIVDGGIQHAPTIFKLEDERLITNFNKDISLMRIHGYKPIVSDIPLYDKTTHMLVSNGFEETEENIVTLHSVEKIDETIEEKIIRLEVEKTELENAILELAAMIGGTMYYG